MIKSRKKVINSENEEFTSSRSSSMNDACDLDMVYIIREIVYFMDFYTINRFYIA